MKDNYFVLKETSEGIYKEKGSRFLSFAIPVSNVEEAEAKIKELKKKYFDSKHVCFAWRIGTQGENTRTYDGGEPSHSAGDPILNVIRSYNLVHTLVVVVRYFGGTQLGLPGLIHAYEASARDAIANNEVIECFFKKQYQIIYPYSQTSLVNQLLHKFKPEIVKSDFSDECRITVEVKKSQADAFWNIMKDNAIFIEE